jgi:hypothetical protein
VTSVGTLAAVLHVLVAAALITTGLADVGAEAAQLLSCLSPYAHYLCGRIAEGGTLHIQLDAAGHHLYILLLQARRGTVVTNSGTIQTGVDAAFVLVVISCHSKDF